MKAVVLRTGCLLIGCLTVTAASAAAQDTRPAEVIDRVAARVNGLLILLSDVRAAAALGIIEPGAEADQIGEMIKRQLLVSEIARFPPQEPPAETESFQPSHSS